MILLNSLIRCLFGGCSHPTGAFLLRGGACDCLFRHGDLSTVHDARTCDILRSSQLFRCHRDDKRPRTTTSCFALVTCLFHPDQSNHDNVRCDRWLLPARLANAFPDGTPSRDASPLRPRRSHRQRHPVTAHPLPPSPKRHMFLKYNRSQTSSPPTSHNYTLSLAYHETISNICH